MGSGEIPVESQGKEMLVAWTRDGEEGADGIKFGRKEQRGVTKKLRVPVSLCVPGVSIHHAFTHSCLYLVSTYDQQQTKETKLPTSASSHQRMQTISMYNMDGQVETYHQPRASRGGVGGQRNEALGSWSSCSSCRGRIQTRLVPKPVRYSHPQLSYTGRDKMRDAPGHEYYGRSADCYQSRPDPIL